MNQPTTKPVTLFGRRMRWDAIRATYQLFGAVVGEHRTLPNNTPGGWFGYCHGERVMAASAQSAARALERKIVAQHKRLGKLIGGGK